MHPRTAGSVPVTNYGSMVMWGRVLSLEALINAIPGIIRAAHPCTPGTSNKSEVPYKLISLYLLVHWLSVLGMVEKAK